MDSSASKAVLLSIVALSVAACGDESEESESQQEATAQAPAQDVGAPVISGSPALSVIAGEFYEFIPSASDPNGDPIIFGIDGLPGWLNFDQQSGRLFGTPGLGDVGIHRGIFVWVSDGQNDDVLPAFDLEVLPPSAVGNQSPIISGTPAGTVAAGDFYDFIPTASDPDGDSLSFQVLNRPAWANFSRSIGRLSGAPGPGDVGVYSGIVIRVRDGIDSADLGPFVIAVNAPADVNSPPTISGIAVPDVLAGAYWSFQPQAQDADGDPLSFEVFNLPSWASFDTQTGFIDGIPGSADAGVHDGVSIVVSDGQASAALPAFSIEVIAQNAAPIISGTPSGSGLADQAYSFTPQASDPDGDALSFSVQNLPVWASFDTATGRISGTPGTGDVGNYTSILILVSDGELSDTLGPFSINVTATATGTASLTWTAPTENTDGSPLTDLAGFRVYWGTVPGNYSNTVTLNGAGALSYVVENLVPGTTYYFATTAFNSSGLESGYSNEGSKTIP